jgi:AraC-like DNA-binding protein
MVVRHEFEKAGVNPLEVNMGEVTLCKPISDNQLKQIDKRLRELRFEILDDKNKKLFERAKAILIKKVQTDEIEEYFSLGDYLPKKINKEYTQLSRLFSEVEGITLEQFFILQKIEKVKEWSAYDELILSEISYRLGYSSVAGLSAQLKKVTGLTPSQFKTLGMKHRKSIDNV